MKIPLRMDDVQLLITAVNESQLSDSIKWNIRTGLDQMQQALQNGEQLVIVSTNELFSSTN